MAALGKGNSRTAWGRWRRRGAVAVIAVAVAAAVHPLVAEASQDPLFPSQWNLQQIGASQAWQRSTGAGIKIGIVDSGVDGSQEDLAGKVVAATDCINTGGNPAACAGSGRDDTGHGTHMAGIAAAAKDNGRGIAGVAPDARLVVARVLTNNGGSIVDVEAGIRWVVAHGAQVVNLSLGDTPRPNAPTDLSFAAAIEEAWAAGAVPVVASGNPNALGPGREGFANVDALVVGATDWRGLVASYSNVLTATKWGLVAPGGSALGDSHDVISTWLDAAVPTATNRYAFRGGASAAAAHVSGVAALLLAEGLNRDEVVRTIVATARPMSCGPDCHGELDAAAAVRAAPAAVAAQTAHRDAPALLAIQPARPAPAYPSTAPPTTAVALPVPPASDAPLEVQAPAIDPGVVGFTAGRDAFVRNWRPAWAVVSVVAGVAFFLLLRRRYSRAATP
jgi:subtilisin family serine protease